MVMDMWIITCIVTFVRHCRCEMLFEIFQRNFISRKVDDEGCCTPSTRSCGETVPLDPSFGRQSMVKPHFRGNRHILWVFKHWGSNPLFPLRIPSQRPSRKLARVPKTQSPFRTPAPCQELPRGGESTKVAVTADNGDDRFILKLRDEDREHLRGSTVFSLEHHR